jgi:sugar phosphate isomerase/epimerase
LIQLSILTNLSPTELDEFKADISKMRMSEQAAFVKEVIHQESIRVARRENKTPEEVVEEIAEEAKKRLAGEEAVKAPRIDLGIAPHEQMILTSKAKKTEDVIAAITREAEDAFVEGAEGMTPSSDRLSDHEIKELKKSLEHRGVHPHEIDTILEQAKGLPRDLVDELVKSLGGEEE